MGGSPYRLRSLWTIPNVSPKFKCFEAQKQSRLLRNHFYVTAYSCGLFPTSIRANRALVRFFRKNKGVILFFWKFPVEKKRFFRQKRPKFFFTFGEKQWVILVYWPWYYVMIVIIKTSHLLSRQKFVLQIHSVGQCFFFCHFCGRFLPLSKIHLLRKTKCFQKKYVEHPFFCFFNIKKKFFWKICHFFSKCKNEKKNTLV